MATADALSPSAYVALGMIRLGQRSGYEIKRAVDVSIRFFWTISHAQVYPSLAALEQRGLVRGRSEPRGRRPRRLFEITRTGERALADWLSAQEPMPFELRDIGLVRLFFADALERDDALRLLDAVARRSEERVAALRAIEPEADDAARAGALYPLLTLRMGIAVHQAMADACRDFEARLAA